VHKARKPAPKPHHVQVAGLRQPVSATPAAARFAAAPVAATELLADPVREPRRAVVVALAVLALVAAARRWVLVGAGLA
jgi:hypothetical protein